MFSAICGNKFTSVSGGREGVAGGWRTLNAEEFRNLVHDTRYY